MIEKRRLCLLLVGLALLLNVAPAFAQCTWCAGTWTDDGGHVWTLTQGTQTTNPSISGNVDTYPAACLVQQWPVDGAFQADGSFYVTATNPVPGDPYCVDWIQYQGTNRTPGCDTGSGNWIASDFTSGPWSWTKPCDTPNGETTTFAGWNASVGQWVQTRLPNDVNRFGGRTVQETDPGGGGPDTCWFQGSQLPPAVSISGGSWTVSAGVTP